MNNNTIAPEEISPGVAMNWLKHRIADGEYLCSNLPPDKSKWSDFDKYNHSVMQMQKVIFAALQDYLKLQPENKPLTLEELREMGDELKQCGLCGGFPKMYSDKDKNQHGFSHACEAGKNEYMLKFETQLLGSEKEAIELWNKIWEETKWK